MHSNGIMKTTTMLITLLLSRTAMARFTILFATQYNQCYGLSTGCQSDYLVCCMGGQTYQSAYTIGLGPSDTFIAYRPQNGESCGSVIKTGRGSQVCLDGGGIGAALVYNQPIGLGRFLPRRDGLDAFSETEIPTMQFNVYGLVENGTAYTIEVNSDKGEAYRNLMSDEERSAFIKAHHTWIGAVDQS